MRLKNKIFYLYFAPARTHPASLHGLSLHQFTIKVGHLLEEGGQPSCFPGGAFVHRLEKRFAEIPGIFKRPQPAWLTATPWSQRFARSFRRPPLITRRHCRAQRTKVSDVLFPIRSMLLLAADLSAGQADLPGIILDYRRRCDQELFHFFSCFITVHHHELLNKDAFQ
jgi:hypothetical protein